MTRRALESDPQIIAESEKSWAIARPPNSVLQRAHTAMQANANRYAPSKYGGLLTVAAEAIFAQSWEFVRRGYIHYPFGGAECTANFCPYGGHWPPTN